MASSVNVGDRVGLLSSTERGQVLRLVGPDVEVLLDDGLEIIVGVRELVVVQPAAQVLPPPLPEAAETTPQPPVEKVLLTEGEAPPTPAPATLPTPGLSELLPDGPGLLLEQRTDGRLGLWVANPLPTPLLVVLYRQTTGTDRWYRIGFYEVGARSVVSCGEWPSGEREQLGRLAVQYAFVPDAAPEPPLWESARLKLTAKTWQRPTTALPKPNLRGVYLPFRNADATLPSEAATGAVGVTVSGKSFSPPLPTAEKPVVDLHIEQVAPHLPGLSPDEKRMLQLAHAERALDHALRLGLPELTLIHGIGKGVLRRDVHALLKGHPHVGAYFEDEQLGSGATRVVLI